MNIVKYFTVFFVISLLSSCRAEPSPSKEKETAPSRPTEVELGNDQDARSDDADPRDKEQRDSLRQDSLWQARVANLPDSLKYGNYSQEGFRELVVQLNDNGTFSVTYESRLRLMEVEEPRAVRAAWTSTWKREEDVFVISRKPQEFRLTGEPPLVSESDAGMVPLDSDKIPNEDIFLWETANMLRDVVDNLDTSYVMLRHKDIKPSEHMLFLLPSGHVPPIKRSRNYYDYNSDVVRSSFHKPYRETDFDLHKKQKDGQR